MTTYLILIIIIIVILVIVINARFQNKRRQEKSTQVRARAYEYFQAQDKEKQSAESAGLSEIYFEVKGLSYRSKQDIAAAGFIGVGDDLILEREPTNEVDPFAVKVMTVKGAHIGYVDRMYSKEVNNRIDYIKRTRVARVSKDAIPFIDAVIEFSSSKTSQASFIPKDLQVGPEDLMTNLSESIASGNYEAVKRRTGQRVIAIVSNSYDFGRETVAVARAMRQGEDVVLREREDDSQYHRIDVVTADGTKIGHISKRDEPQVLELLGRIERCIVEQPISDQYKNLGLAIYFTGPKPDSDWGCESDAIYIREYREAEELKKIDPHGALDILLPIAPKERGIEIKHLCCQCFRNLKDYEREREMIMLIIDQIERFTDEDLPHGELAALKNSLPTYIKRLNTVESRIK